MSFAEQNKLAMQQQQHQQLQLIQSTSQQEHAHAQQQMNDYQQQLRRTDPVYASMASHNVSPSSSNPSPPPPGQRQTPPPDMSFEMSMAEEFAHSSRSTILKRPDLMPSRCHMHWI